MVYNIQPTELTVAQAILVYFCVHKYIYLVYTIAVCGSPQYTTNHTYAPGSYIYQRQSGYLLVGDLVTAGMQYQNN